MSITAMRLALEAIESDTLKFSAWTEKMLAASTALRQAIEQAEQAQPVVWMVYTLDGKSAFVTDNPADFTEKHRALPLYTAPPQRPRLDQGPDYERGFIDGMQQQMQSSVDKKVNAMSRQWVGLTDEEVTSSQPYAITRDKGCFHAGAKWANDKLKEKNT